jgi:hypothetical protein
MEVGSCKYEGRDPHGTKEHDVLVLMEDVRGVDGESKEAHQSAHVETRGHQGPAESSEADHWRDIL